MYQLSIKSPIKMNKRRKESISREIKSYIGPDDVIASLLCFLEKEEITGNPRILHSSINRLKDEYPELLKDFTFTRGDIYPFSRDLEMVFFRLQNSGIMKMMNPDFDVYRTTHKSKNGIKKVILSKFPKEKQDKLKEMSVKFENDLSNMGNPE